MSKIKDSIEDEKDLINKELDYFYFKEKELLGNIADVLELRQSLIAGLKDDLKRLADVYKVKDEEEDTKMELCRNCSIPSENIYCETCQREIENGSDYYEKQD